MTRRAWLLFILSSVIWGVPYLFIKIAVDAGIAPAFIAWSRIALAAALLLPLAIQRKVLQGLRERTAAIIGYTPCEVADRESTRLNSSHITKSYSVFCLKKKKKKKKTKKITKKQIK